MQLKVKENEDVVGHDEIDVKYLGKCSNFYYEYDECVRDCIGDIIYCDKFRKALQRCEEESGMFEDVLKTLKIEPKTRSYRKYTNIYGKKDE